MTLRVILRSPDHVFDASGCLEKIARVLIIFTGQEWFPIVLSKKKLNIHRITDRSRGQYH